MKIGIIGGMGIVGGTTRKYLQQRTGHTVRVFDPPQGKNDDIFDCPYVFICVPVPTCKDGSQDLAILKEVIPITGKKSKLLIRSTVLPGTCDALAKEFNRQIYSMPEFLTERTAYQDMIDLPIVTGMPYPNVHLALVFPGKKFIGMTNMEAELSKYTHNCFAAVKINYFNDIKIICDTEDADYDNVLLGALMTGFINKTHTQVPGHDGKLGFGGKCLPKDLKAFAQYYAVNILDQTFSENRSIRNEEFLSDNK